MKPLDPQAEDLQETGGAPPVRGDLPVLIGGTFHEGLADAAMDAAMYKVEASGGDAYERGGALPVVGAAPALAEGTAGVEPAGDAEIATAAKLEALVP